MELITQFAKIHQFDDRHAYKEAWEKYVHQRNDFMTSVGHSETASSAKGAKAPRKKKPVVGTA